YMAPEQALAGMAGPHADQFGFCVALWEALYGRRPFGGNTPRDSARAVLRDAPAPGPTKAVPRGIRRALERGLRANPWERWPSLGELLGELEDQRRRPRQRAAMAASMVVVGLAAGVWIAWPTSSHCDGTSLPDPIGAWTPPRRERLGAQFESVGGTFARPTWQRVDQRIDSFVGSWQDTYRTLCARPGPLPPSDGMQACLDDHRDRFAAVLDVFEHADATTVERAVAVVGPLATVTECLDPQASRVTTTPTDDGAGPQVAQLRTALAQVAALEQSGRYDEALTRAQPLTEMAREVDAPSLLATALLRQGSVRIEAGQIDRAGPELEEAYFIALSLRDDAVTLEAATRLVHLWGTKAARFERAQSWARHAHASLSRRASPEGEAVLLRELAVVHAEKGRHPQARNYAEQALAISESLHPADDPRVAVAMDTLAGVEHRMGQFDAALEHFERAHAIRVQALGPDHPDTLLTGMRLALVRDQTGDGEQAQARFSAVLEKLEASVGPHHPAVAMVLINMGSALVRDGHLDRAVPRLERALAIRRATRFDHPHTAITMHNLGTAAAMAGHDAKAREYFEQVLGIFERTQGRGHPTVADVLVNLGRMSARSGDLEQAERQYWHAYAIYLAALGPEHISVANLLTNLARLALQRSQPELAIRHARRALVIRERELGAAHPDTVTTREILTTATRDATTDP
nr:tetratricopeptide repeat protein [Deltaproteobacteria bacterium]